MAGFGQTGWGVSKGFVDGFAEVDLCKERLVVYGYGKGLPCLVAIQLSKIKWEKVAPSVAVLVGLSKRYGVSVDWMLTGRE